jgi:hypothetical protein
MRFLVYIIAILLLMPSAADAQCRAFTKNKCLPQLEGYVQNDNYNSAVLIAGDQAELLLTFYGNKQYRLLVCVNPILGNIDYEVRDTNGELIYKANTGDADTFDFKMVNTQQLIVKLMVPEKDAVLPHEGCVTVLVGSKEMTQ